MEWKEECQQFDYVFHGPLRIVPPYTFPQKANAKARWQGRRLQDVFSAEFPHACEDDPLGFFTKAVEEGRLYINGDMTTSAEHRIKPADEIVHLVRCPHMPMDLPRTACPFWCLPRPKQTSHGAQRRLRDARRMILCSSSTL